MIRSWLIEQHQLFFAQLPFLVFASRDELDRPWATLIPGSPGFATCPDETHLRIQTSLALGGPSTDHLQEGASVGILGIELSTRRRNRLNGVVETLSDEEFVVRVQQSYGNCPKYITPRIISPSPRQKMPPPKRSTSLSPEDQKSIELSDTFFIATGTRASTGSSHGMDVSHRGGAPGFVVVDDERTLTFPDYSGNNLFNTLGNLELDPSCGLLFVDFASGSLTHLTGSAVVDWDSTRIAQFPSAKRLVQFRVDEICTRKGALPFEFRSEDA